MQKKILIGFIILLLVACNKGEAPSHAPSVVTQEATLEEVTNTASYPGSVTTVEMIELLPRIEGYLQKRLFEQGQLVQAGDLLFVIEPDQYEAVVMQKEADLAAAEATLAERTLNVDRMRILLEKKVVAKANVDQAESDYYNATANVKAAKAALIQAQLNLSYTKITAPITGRIGTTAFSPGDYLSPSTSTLATIVQLDPIRVVFSIPEQVWLGIETQQERTSTDLNEWVTPKLKLSNGTIYEGAGKIAFSDNHIDTNTGSLAIYATFDNPHALLLPGQFVTVMLALGQAREALMVPASAILFDKTGHYVMRVNAEQKVEQQYVSIGIKQNNKIEITQGLSPHDQVIVEGLQKVAPGMQVSPTPKKV